MAIDLTPEQRAVGEANFRQAQEKLGLNRRDFLKAGAAATGALAGSAAMVYFGYQGMKGRPVRAALIGCGDEGGVLAGEHNPEYLEFIALCDIRPSNRKRIFKGEPRGPRRGLNYHYGKDAEKKIRMYTDYKELLQNKDIEAVVIALPLHLHAPVAIDAMRAGKHVLCEKLMAWCIPQCKQMIQVAKETGRILSIGHQRHYSMLYAHALEVVKSGLLGDIKHIRALWHRNFSWPYVAPKGAQLVKGVKQPKYRDSWYNPILAEDYDALKDKVKQYGYDDVEQLIRWRLYAETGGGLMAELGSHQLDACSIFLGKVHPLAVTGVGVKSFYGPDRNDRDINDHVFVTYEFPGPNHPKGPARPDGSRGNDPHDVVVVTYSSISTNQFENYGECLMGTRGTMIVEQEQRVMLYKEKDPNKQEKPDVRSMQVSVSTTGGKPALDSTGSDGGPAAPAGATAAAAGAPAPISRGYREEMEDFAYCVRLWDPRVGYAEEGGQFKQRLPRCHGRVAMADAIIALTSNQAMANHQRIEFKEEWFHEDSAEVPDKDAKPKIIVT